MIERAYMITSKEIEHNYIEIGYNKYTGFFVKYEDAIS